MPAIGWMWLHSVGLGYINMIHKVMANSGYMITLCETWDSTTNIFHLLTRECIVTLEDVWRIMRISIKGSPFISLPDEVG